MEATSDQILSLLKQKFEANDAEGAAILLKDCCNPKMCYELLPDAIQLFESNSQLLQLQIWFERLIDEGETNSDVNTALAKICILLNNNPQTFLRTNDCYDCLAVGKYCEEIDPNLAILAYKKGKCDRELIEFTNKHSLFSTQAKYLLEAKSEESWDQVVDPANPLRKNLFEELDKILPETSDPEDISVLLKALMKAAETQLLMQVLEALLFQNPVFKENKMLQNLLILTAIKADPAKVKDYLERFDNYSAVDIAKVAENYSLYEEAILAYKKSEAYEEAIRVYVEKKNDLAGARMFAESINKPEVWTVLGNEYLKNGMVDEAVEIYLQEGITSNYKEIIGTAGKIKNHEKLAKYLQLIRNSKKEADVDNELGYCLAKAKELQGLGELLAGDNLVDTKALSERCTQEGLTEALEVISKINK